MSVIEGILVSDLPSGAMKSFMVGGKKLLIANVGGHFYAVDNTCTHAGGDLSNGKLEGTTVTCPRHGSKFDVTTGRNLSGPKIPFFKPKVRDLNAYAVKIEGDSIAVDI
ncbi:MAG: non-heme iron oxygenase ferredoxin subunit [Dehalococcoidales bacterium]|nr:non-heme iron oxygenase ferredoxin subunit [Dehalococcoidales bacterium]